MVAPNARHIQDPGLEGSLETHAFLSLKRNKAWSKTPDTHHEQPNASKGRQMQIREQPLSQFSTTLSPQVQHGRRLTKQPHSDSCYQRAGKQILKRWGRWLKVEQHIAGWLDGLVEQVMIAVHLVCSRSSKRRAVRWGHEAKKDMLKKSVSFKESFESGILYVSSIRCNHDSTASCQD